MCCAMKAHKQWLCKPAPVLFQCFYTHTPLVIALSIIAKTHGSAPEGCCAQLAVNVHGNLQDNHSPQEGNASLNLAKEASTLPVRPFILRPIPVTMPQWANSHGQQSERKRKQFCIGQTLHLLHIHQDSIPIFFFLLTGQEQIYTQRQENTASAPCLKNAKLSTIHACALTQTQHQKLAK